MQQQQSFEMLHNIGEGWGLDTSVPTPFTCIFKIFSHFLLPYKFHNLHPFLSHSSSSITAPKKLNRILNEFSFHTKFYKTGCVFHLVWFGLVYLLNDIAVI